MPDTGKKLSEKTWLDDQEKLERLAVLIVREIDRILFDLDFRRDLLVTLFSRERIRMPLLRALESRYYDLKFDMLVLFPPDVIQELDDFYRALDDFIFYVAYTEDMPQKLAQKFDMHLDELKNMGAPLIENLKLVAPNVAIELAALEPPMPAFTFDDSDSDGPVPLVKPEPPTE